MCHVTSLREVPMPTICSSYYELVQTDRRESTSNPIIVMHARWVVNMTCHGVSFPGLGRLLAADGKDVAVMAIDFRCDLFLLRFLLPLATLLHSLVK